MSIAQLLLAEFDEEMEATRRVLERVPTDRLDWQPHEKSMKMGHLASHVAEMMSWVAVTLTQDEFDVAPPGGPEFTPTILGSTTAIVELFDKNASEARALIESTTDEAFMETWTFKRGGKELFSAPKTWVLRRFVMNHVIHHRGQLTVYLRLTDTPVPSTIGQTADEPAS